MTHSLDCLHTVTFLETILNNIVFSHHYVNCFLYNILTLSCQAWSWNQDLMSFIWSNVNICHLGHLYNSITHIPDKPWLLFYKYQAFTGNLNPTSVKIPGKIQDTLLAFLPFLSSLDWLPCHVVRKRKRTNITWVMTLYANTIFFKNKNSASYCIVVCRILQENLQQTAKICAEGLINIWCSRNEKYPTSFLPPFNNLF